MKRLIASALLALSSIAFAATTVPPTMLNPAGSASGQVIKSTGPGTAPAWGNVTATSLAAQAANTVVANATSSSATPTAFAMPSCSTSTSALTYTSNAGFTCSSAMAPLASPTFTGTVTAPTFKAAAMAHVKANNTSGQSIPNNAYTAVTGWATVFDANSNFNASTGVFTAPATAYYRISCQLLWGTLTVSSSNVLAAGLFIGASGTPDSAGYAPAAASTSSNVVVENATLSLASGNTVTCKAFQNSGSAATLSTSAPQVQISIDQLP
ncbi:hypothetical protein [Paraburkholderia diazotrophica]|uniref:C1q domain-containing protein n=1 Tax=Paraburkholderia diazotrophica TaxID=667676 RepID=A0A1H6UVK7_9BURK|nr:hypothetical protein [Paraburkholderia diazotrophica]SEI96298.1 hypothetical protein SAMN05192539_1005212 [Paraburkholderia diazotrophica]